MKTLCQNDDGSTDVTVDLDDSFKRWFMYMHNLYEWDEKYFEQWFLNTLGDYIGVDPNE